METKLTLVIKVLIAIILHKRSSSTLSFSLHKKVQVINMLRVIEKNQVSLNMLRITLQGDQLENISWKPGCYIKLSIPSGEKRKMRTYTARSYDAQRRSLDVDFAIHQPAGSATKWALEAKIGDEVEV